MNKITALVTVYYPNIENRKNIEKILAQSDRLIICDNTPTENRELFSCLEQITYCFFGKNLGLSAAFNKILRDDSYGWNDDDFIIFFDQDSVIGEKHIEHLIDEYKVLEDARYRIGCIGPVVYNICSGRVELPKMKKNINNKTMIVKSVITTSLLCRYSVLKKVDFWNDEVFLDMADWDLCWRMQAEKMLCCMTYASVIKHRVGEGDKQIGFIHMRVGKPIRDYYQTRDCIYLLRKRYTPLKFKIKFIERLTIRPMMRFIFLDHRRERIRYIWKGFKDYGKGVRGEISN